MKDDAVDRGAKRHLYNHLASRPLRLPQTAQSTQPSPERVELFDFRTLSSALALDRSTRADRRSVRIETSFLRGIETGATL